MKRILKVVAGLLATALVAVVVFAVPTIWGTPWTYEHFTLRVLIVEFLQAPELTTQLGIAIPFTDLESELTDRSPEAHKAGLARLDRAIEMHEAFDRPDDDIGRVSYDVFGVFLRNQRAVEGFGSYTIDHIDGPHQSLPDFLVQFHKVTDDKTAESYLSRLSKVPRALEQSIAFARHRAEQGFVAPTFILAKIVKDAQGFASGSPDKSAVVVDFAKKLKDANVAGADDYVQRATQLVERQVFPAFLAYARDMEALRPQSTDDPGMWKFEKGPADYRARLRQMTTTELTADEIHATGQETLAALEAQARPLLDELGVTYETVGEGLRSLAAEPRSLFEDSDAGRQEALTYSRELVAKIDALSKPHFGVQPKAGVEVKQVPDLKAESAPFAYYRGPALDGSRGGVFFLNLRDMVGLSKIGLPTLVCHEAIPGHHFQIGVAQTLDELPFFRRLIPFNAFAEGWALYAERLCDRFGFYESPETKLGHLAAQAFRAARLVVDTGLHHGKWSRQQAVDFMLAHTGESKTDVEAEVDRYTMWPGQACGYMVGQLKLLELRKYAEDELGDAFDAKAFHDRILTFGSMPLDVLEREMRAWTSGQKGG